MTAVWRQSMADLVDRTRTLIGDPLVDGQDPNVDQLDLLAFIDGRATPWRYLGLWAEATLVPTSTSWLTFRADVGDWEADATFVDGSWAAVTPDTSDWHQGVWTFTAQPTLPVRITGTSYDLAAAAADALEAWAAEAARCYDMTVDGQNLSRSQLAAGLRESARLLRLQAMPTDANLIRIDSGGTPW